MGLRLRMLHNLTAVGGAPMNFGIESVEKFSEIAHYGPLWLVEFRDYSRVIVIEDPQDSPDENYIIEPEQA